MQYVRLYVNAQAQIEHVETSTRPLPTDSAIQVTGPIGLLPGMTTDEILTLPVAKVIFDEVKLEMTPHDGTFMRARPILESVEVDPITLKPRMKPGPRTRHTFRKVQITRANRGSG